MGGWFYLRFFVKKESNPEFKNQLPSAHFLNIISIVAICLWTLFGGLIFFGVPLDGFNFNYGHSKDKNANWFGAILSAALYIVIYGGLQWYWMGVTKRYAGVA